MLTLTQAAKETGLTRSAIFKAIKSGRLSATKDDQGHFLIQPGELFRVYKPVDKVDVSSTQAETGQEAQETAFLRREIELLQQQIKRDGDQIADLKGDRDHWRQTATMLLTHQPEAPKQTKPEDSPLWRKLFGKRI